MIAWLKHRWILGLTLALGIGIGTVGNWWINRPPPPWLEFPSIQATYERGKKTIRVSGRYTARKACSREEQATPPNAPNPLIWRQEVRGTGPQVVLYAPIPEPPALEIGTHDFTAYIPLEEGIEPDGWEVAVTVSCDREPYAIRSRSVKVEYLSINSEEN